MASLGASDDTISQAPAPAFSKPCLTCRRRKVKCDKLTRPCGNCARTRHLCLYDGDEPPSGTITESIEGIPSTDREVRDRLERLEKLMEAVMVGDGGRGGANRSGAGVGGAVARTPSANLSRSQRTTISPSPSSSFQTSVSPATDTHGAPVGQIVFQEGHSAYFDSDFWAGLIPEVWLTFSSLFELFSLTQ